MKAELGVLTWTQIETEDYHTNEFLNNIKVDRSYNYGEVLTVAPDRLNNFEALTKKFFTEHLHEEEEIRFILDGIGTILLSTPKWSLTQLYLRLMCDNIHSHHFSAHMISGCSSIWY
jgi:cupin superfamily acireductone dioxygenase involved in methionine salvage